MSLPPILRPKKAAIGEAGRRSEKRLGKALGARPRPASGAMPGAKGDLALPTVLLEAKSTTAASLTLKHDWLIKIATEARAENKQPALAVSFTDAQGRPVKDGEWVLMPLRRWRELTGD